jgi:hypothetical protein
MSLATADDCDRVRDVASGGRVELESAAAVLRLAAAQIRMLVAALEDS